MPAEEHLLGLGNEAGDCLDQLILEDGCPVAMIPATGQKEDSEAREARALLASTRSSSKTH